MTPQELHSRILLHELRTILLDETREGDQITQEWKDAIQQDLHSPTPYLVLADDLDEAGSDLGELCRIQVELIGVLPVDGEMVENPTRANHPFHRDFCLKQSLPAKHLLERRREIVEPLYTELHQIERPNSPPALRHIPRQSRLGRTTRMLTDVLRYCTLNQGKSVLVQCPIGGVQDMHDDLANVCEEILESPPAWSACETINYISDCRIHFTDRNDAVILRTHSTSRREAMMARHAGDPLTFAREQAIHSGFDPNIPFQTEYGIERQAWLSTQTFPPDIHFTDHACPQMGMDQDLMRRTVEMLANYASLTGNLEPFHRYAREWAEQNGIDPNFF